MNTEQMIGFNTEQIWKDKRELIQQIVSSMKAVTPTN